MFRSVSQEKLSVVSSFMNLPWGDLKKNQHKPTTHTQNPLGLTVFCGCRETGRRHLSRPCLLVVLCSYLKMQTK